jgi:hypothetical protein
MAVIGLYHMPLNAKSVQDASADTENSQPVIAGNIVSMLENSSENYCR